MSAFSSTGTTLALAVGAPATYDQAGFEGVGMSYVVVGEVSDMGEAEASAEEINHTPVSTGVIEKLKGSLNYGNFSVQFARDTTDAGQILIKAGFDGTEKNSIHSARLTDQNGDKIYFTCRIMADGISIGSANQVFGGNTTLAVLRKFVAVAAV